jgi:hypothetical protein
MPKIEYAVDEWDLRAREPELDAGELLRHLQEFGDEGWELATLALNIDLKNTGRGHLLVFRRVA